MTKEEIVAALSRPAGQSDLAAETLANDMVVRLHQRVREQAEPMALLMNRISQSLAGPGTEDGLLIFLALQIHLAIMRRSVAHSVPLAMVEEASKVVAHDLAAQVIRRRAQEAQ